jgi:hypothetical protein
MSLYPSLEDLSVDSHAKVRSKDFSLALEVERLLASLMWT